MRFTRDCIEPLWLDVAIVLLGALVLLLPFLLFAAVA